MGFNAIAVGQIKPVTATPTFVIWDPILKKEMDRLIGYKDREWFIEAMQFWIDNHNKYYDEDGNIRPEPLPLTDVPGAELNLTPASA